MAVVFDPNPGFAASVAAASFAETQLAAWRRCRVTCDPVHGALSCSSACLPLGAFPPGGAARPRVVESVAQSVDAFYHRFPPASGPVG